MYNFSAEAPAMFIKMWEDDDYECFCFVASFLLEPVAVLLFKLEFHFLFYLIKSLVTRMISKKDQISPNGGSTPSIELIRICRTVCLLIWLEKNSLHVFTKIFSFSFLCYHLEFLLKVLLDGASFFWDDVLTVESLFSLRVRRSICIFQCNELLELFFM